MERVFESGQEEGGGIGRNVILAFSQFSQGEGFLPCLSFCFFHFVLIVFLSDYVLWSCTTVVTQTSLSFVET